MSIYRIFFYLPSTHVLYISVGSFCAPEYFSVFAEIEMSSACIVDVLYYALLSTNIVLCGQTVDLLCSRTGFESCAEQFK